MDEIGLVDYEGSWHPEEGSSAASTPMDLSSVLGSLFDFSGSGYDSESLNNLIEQYKSFILENTNYNNAWSAEQAEKMMDFQRSEREWAQLFNQGEAAKNRDWQKMMSDTAHQREVADLKAAGLNPILSARGGNGAAVGSGATAAASVPGHGAQGNPDQSANSAITGFLGSAFSAMTNMASKMVDAQTSLAVAAKYTDMERMIESMKEEFSAWEHENYPSNIYETVSAVLHAFGLGDSSPSGNNESGKGQFESSSLWNIFDHVFHFDDPESPARKHGAEIRERYNEAKEKYGDKWWWSTFGDLWYQLDNPFDYFKSLWKSVTHDY